MKVILSKPMTARYEMDESLEYRLVADEGPLAMFWGGAVSQPLGEYLTQLTVCTRLLKIRHWADVVVTGRYGDLLALFQGLVPIGRRPLLLLDTEWMLRPRGRIRKTINIMLQRFISKGAKKIQVICKAEAKAYSEYYGIPEDKFVWIPYCPPIEETSPETAEEDYIFSGGRHQRDWKTFYDAVRGIPLEVRIAAPDHQVPKEYVSDNMVLLGRLPRDAYFQQMARSKFVVLALDPVVRFPGVITYVYAMRMGKCVVVNEPIGAVSYIEDGKTGRIVAARDSRALHEAITELLRNPELRQTMGKQAKEVADREYCPQAYWRHVDAIVKTLQAAKSDGDTPEFFSEAQA